MSWLGLVALVLCLYLAFKVAGVVLKLALWALVIVAAYWFAAPMLGWPSLPDLVYVLGPDLDGRRIEDLADPSRLAKQAADHVVDGVAERIAGDARDAAPAQLPEPRPEEAHGRTREQALSAAPAPDDGAPAR